MSQTCSRPLFTGVQLGTVSLPLAFLPSTSSTCQLCRTASPSWLQVPCWLISSNRRMRCGRLTAYRFDGTATYAGTHAGSDWLYAHTNIEHRCSDFQTRTYITINPLYFICIIHKRPHWHTVKLRQFRCDIIHSGSILMTIFIESVSISPEFLERICTCNI